MEIDPIAQHVYKTHFPKTPIHGDIKNYVPSKDWNYRNGIVYGGFPCQDTSSAGAKRGLDGQRSGLWWEFLRVVKTARPAFVLVENPEGLRHRGLLDVLRSLAQVGYNVEWQTVSARGASGTPHLRNRIFVIAYTHHLSKWIERQANSWAECLRKRTEEAINADPFESRLKGGLPKSFKASLPAESNRFNSRLERKDVERRAESSNAVPPWLGGIASEEWCQRWQPPAHPGRPKKARPGQDPSDFKGERWACRKAIGFYGNACIPEQAQLAFERIEYFFQLGALNASDLGKQSLACIE